MTSEDSRFVENHKEYMDIFHVFSRSRREQRKTWIESDLIPKIRDTFTQDKHAPKSEFSVLAVGSNDGSFDCLLLKAMLFHMKEFLQGKQLIYTVVEPNSVAIDEFKLKASLQDGVFRNVKFNWVNKGMQEFLKGEKTERYDLIHFMQVLYYAENEEEILTVAYEKFLARPGCIVVAVGSECDVWGVLIKSFKMRIPSMLKNLTNIELSELFKRNGWAYDIFETTTHLEITELFNERDRVGQAILKFFLHINEDPKEVLGEKLVSEIIEFFRRMSWEGIKDGKKCLFATEIEGILLAYKRY